MEGRTRLAIGGAATVAASIALICAVSMTTSAALADAPGAPSASVAFVLPAVTVAPSPTASTSPVAAEAPAPVEAPVDEPVTVPAPAPEELGAHPEPHTPAVEPSVSDQDQLVAIVKESGSWDAVYAWAKEQGWPDGRIEAWIKRLEPKIAADDQWRQSSGEDGVPRSHPGDKTAPKTPAVAGKTSGLDLSGSSFGSMREHSRVPPD